MKQLLFIFIVSVGIAHADLRCQRFFLDRETHHDVFELFEKAQNLTPNYSYPELSLKARKAIELEYLSKDMDEVSVDKIKAYIARMDKSPDELIVFRGQTELSSKVQSMNVRENGHEEARILFSDALEEMAQRINANYRNFEKKRHLGRYRASSDFNHERTASQLSYFLNVKDLDFLAIQHLNSYGGKHFVSTTRDLSVAFGNFYMAPENMRYIYIMKVPKKSAVNTHGLSKYQSDALGISEMSGLGEKEISIAHDATDFIEAVFDLQKKEFVDFK